MNTPVIVGILDRVDRIHALSLTFESLLAAEPTDYSPIAACLIGEQIRTIGEEIKELAQETRKVSKKKHSVAGLGAAWQGRARLGKLRQALAG